MNPNQRQIICCKGCNIQKEHHAKGYCYNCYKKLWWVPKKITCKNCGKDKPHKAFGLCSSCHMKKHHYHLIKEYNSRKYHRLDLETYKKITTRCILCGFDCIVELHHLDHNHQNNDSKNLLGLCPNHHKMYHHEVYREKITKMIAEALHAR